MKPPVAKVIPAVTQVHGEVRVDEYAWLRDRSNPEVLQYLEAENRYTEAVMRHTEPLQEALYREIRGRIKETDLSAPEKLDEYYYYSRTEQGRQYAIHCRKKGSLDAEEELLLDENALAAGHPYFRLGVALPSPNHRLLAYSTDTTGSETYTIFVKDLSTGQLLSDPIANAHYGFQWGNDNRTLFYTTLDDARRPYKLFRRRLGSGGREDDLVYHEKDEMFFVYISKTRSKQYLLLSLESKTTSEVHFLPAGRPYGEFRVIHPRQHEMEYGVDHHGDTFYILTNENAKNFKLMAAPVAGPAKENWREILPHRETVKIDSVEAFRHHLVLLEREDGLRKIRVQNLQTEEVHYVDFPEPVYTFHPGANPDFNTSLLRFEYTSLITPLSVYDYDMNARTRDLKKQYEVLGGYDPSLYRSERVFASAPDGVRIPISMVYKKGMAKDGSRPLLLYGYGAYGISVEPGFSPDRLSLLDRGFVFAIAHVRGGGEMGRHWHEQGKLLQKKNTFTDFIACAAHLIAQGYTSREKLAIYGGSAGGLLMGAVVNMRPELFHIVIAKVPFVDVVNTMLDESLPLTITEFEEWGDPKKQEFYQYMRSYSPYDNIEARPYPHMLVTAGLNDARVAYWEPAKWVARLRRLKTNDCRLLLKTNMSAGHGGASGRYERMKETAFEYAFLFDLLEAECRSK
jgi:oligopeptidase B